MKKAITALLAAMIISAFPSLGICAGAKVETPVNICCIGDLYSVDYEFDVSGEIEDVRCDIDGGMFTSNYKKDENKLYISYAASTASKAGRIATVISSEKITLTPVLVKLNGWITENDCVYHAEIAMDEKEPTIDTDGSRGGVKCARCGFVAEEPTILPAVGPTVSATLSEDNTLKIKGALSDKEKADGAVLAGVYGGEKFIVIYDISTQNQNNINLSIENMAVADTVKIFRWDSLSNLKPTSDVIEVEVKHIRK